MTGLLSTILSFTFFILFALGQAFASSQISDNREMSITNDRVGVRCRNLKSENHLVLELFGVNAEETSSTFATMKFSVVEGKEPKIQKSDERSELTVETLDQRILFSFRNTPNDPFILITMTPLFDGTKERDALALPTMTISSDSFGDVSVKDLRAFGTAGLKPIDGHQGSYAFLSIVEPVGRRGVIAGWLTGYSGSGILFSDKNDNGATLTAKIDYGRLPLPTTKNFKPETLAVGYFDDARIGLERYADALAAWNNVKIKPAPTGYCSWYSNQHGGAGDENSTAEFAKIAREKLVPFGMSYFQIDDGWQLGDSKNGPNKNFTNVRDDGPYQSGLRSTAETLNENGLTCGVWFMPFSGNFDDPYFADKQDFFVRSGIDYPSPGEKNTRTYPMINQKKDAPYETFWGGTALDMTNPKARDYVANVTRRIAQEWNCHYFKIDGLWTGGAIEQLYVNDEYKPDDIGCQKFYDPDATNAEAFRLGMKTVREAAGEDVFILGCNLSQNMRTLLGSVGFVDAMRIGPDNGADWKGICAGPWRGTNRYFLNGRVWWNDPDPVYVRDSIPLSHARVITSWAALTGQLYAFSDWLPTLSDERVNLLRKTMPNHHRTTVRPVDLFTSDMARVWILSDQTPDKKPDETRYVIGLFNWDEKESAEFNLSPETLGLPTRFSDGSEIREFVVYNFWNEKFEENIGAGTERPNLTLSIPGGSCAILAVRPERNHPTLLSTSRNITQGIYEVTSEEWDANKMTLSVTVDPKRAALGEELPYELRITAPEGFGLTGLDLIDDQGNAISPPSFVEEDHRRGPTEPTGNGNIVFPRCPLSESGCLEDKRLPR